MSLTTSDDAHARLAAKVAAIEARTDAEIVLVLAESTAPYADVSWRAGALAASLVAIVLELVPWLLPGSLLLALALVVGAATGLLVRRPPLLRRLVPEARRHEAVRRAAEAAFVRHAVHGTPHHTGLLVFVAELEQRVEVVADLGLQGLLPEGALAKARALWRRTDLDSVLAGFDALGDALAAAAPHRGAASDRVDLPDAPRIWR